MKKLILSILSLAVVATLSVSCSKIYTGSNQDARVYEPTNTTPLTRPLTADVNVVSQDRITDTWTFDLTPSKKIKSLDKNGELPTSLKVKALAKSANKNNADMIIAATFDYEQKMKVSGLFRKVKSNIVTVTVSGYPARFSNWKPVSQEAGDYEWIQDFYGNKFGWNKKCDKSNVSVVINADK